MLRVVVASAILIVSGLASADPEPQPAVAEPSPAVVKDPAWEAYDAAFASAARGDRVRARALLTDLTLRWPEHPAATRARSLVDELTREDDARRTPSKYSNVARGELVFWSTIGGVFVGANICVIVDCESDRENAAVYTLSVGGSLALSLAASRGGVQHGEAQLYNSSQTWGSWNSLAINDDFADESDQALVALSAQAGGLLAGIGLWQTWRPTQGDVALTNSVFLWTTVMSLWGHLAVDEEPTLRRTVLIGDVGIIAGALLSTQVKMSRGRTLLIDTGGVLGILLGGVIAIGVSGEEKAVGISFLIGNGVGLGIATLATRDWDHPDGGTQLTVTPTRLVDPSGRGIWGVNAGLRF